MRAGERLRNSRNHPAANPSSRRRRSRNDGTSLRVAMLRVDRIAKTSKDFPSCQRRMHHFFDVMTGAQSR
jgi:hypothetical protein